MRLWPCQSQDPCLGWCFLRLWHFLLPLRPVWFWRGKNAFCRYLGMVYTCLIRVVGFCFWTFIIHHTICIYWCFLNLDRLLLFIFPTLLWRWKPGSVEHWWQEREAGAIEGAISPISTSTISASKSASWHQAGLRYLMFAHNYLNFRKLFWESMTVLSSSSAWINIRCGFQAGRKERRKANLAHWWLQVLIGESLLLIIHIEGVAAACLWYNTIYFIVLYFAFCIDTTVHIFV